jgi:quinol monooxygenase YgiN
MELLVVTLAYIQPGQDANAQATLQQVVDTVRSAIGIITVRVYRGREHGLYYLLMTTWEDEESWHKAQDRYDPRTHLLERPELLLTAPEQWLMSYQWGYTRPARTSNISTAHIMTIPAGLEATAQQAWIDAFQRQALAPTLAFAFLARGIDRDATAPRRAIKKGQQQELPKNIYQQGPILLSFLSWASEIEREEFYTSSPYRVLQKKVEAAGISRILPLDPL